MKNSTESIRLVDVYPYRKGDSDIEFLVMKRSESVIYSGQWRMVGGKVKEGESAILAAKRELLEETGLQPHIFWCVPSVNTFFDIKHDCIHHIPVFSVELRNDEKPVLNHEHTAFGWHDTSQAMEAVSWPEQKRLIKLISDLVNQKQILNDWII